MYKFKAPSTCMYFALTIHTTQKVPFHPTNLTKLTYYLKSERIPYQTNQRQLSTMIIIDHTCDDYRNEYKLTPPQPTLFSTLKKFPWCLIEVLKLRHDLNSQRIPKITSLVKRNTMIIINHTCYNVTTVKYTSTTNCKNTVRSNFNSR